jgi:hypothetical protein
MEEVVGEERAVNFSADQHVKNSRDEVPSIQVLDKVVGLPLLQELIG